MEITAETTTTAITMTMMTMMMMMMVVVMMFSDAETLHAQQSARNVQCQRLFDCRHEEEKEGQIDTGIFGNNVIIPFGYFFAF